MSFKAMLIAVVIAASQTMSADDDAPLVLYGAGSLKASLSDGEKRGQCELSFRPVCCGLAGRPVHVSNDSSKWIEPAARQLFGAKFPRTSFRKSVLKKTTLTPIFFSPEA